MSLTAHSRSRSPCRATSTTPSSGGGQAARHHAGVGPAPAPAAVPVEDRVTTAVGESFEKVHTPWLSPRAVRRSISSAIPDHDDSVRTLSRYGIVQPSIPIPGREHRLILIVRCETHSQLIILRSLSWTHSSISLVDFTG
jgi:hypothetical protein